MALISAASLQAVFSTLFRICTYIYLRIVSMNLDMREDSPECWHFGTMFSDSSLCRSFGDTFAFRRIRVAMDDRCVVSFKSFPNSFKPARWGERKS